MLIYFDHSRSLGIARKKGGGGRGYIPFPSRSHNTHCILRIRIRLGLKDHIHRIRLGVEACRLVIAIPHVLRVVDDHYCGFERHGGRRLGVDGYRRRERSIATFFDSKESVSPDDASSAVFVAV